jgi:hypothetical protein
MVEEREDISELIYDCVNYLRRDEQGTAEGSSDLLVDSAYPKLSAAIARPIGAQSTTTVGDEDDFDTVD